MAAPRVIYLNNLFLCVTNNILIDISGTKENGKFDSGEKLDIDVRMFLIKYGCSIIMVYMTVFCTKHIFEVQRND